ncbi:hypothetical protein SELSPUOL_02598 [Selenomonas sputigena ATCC 35185]|uniref:Uncharacterized protein n=1 Tax=Selenomonas sputigena (strain ATCC 35185 / DSM 20758 / CCUG 44933 / VPI D19B-28) TaxID=546271 RepID=C9LYN7_SELS3|nr:hypothetical protein SELSPUOL_02598 [Selenomonas sputigena ATCC 35185]
MSLRAAFSIYKIYMLISFSGAKRMTAVEEAEALSRRCQVGEFPAPRKGERT